MGVAGWIITIILGSILVFIAIWISLISPRVKNQYIKDAYRLLKKSNPNLREIKETIKGLNAHVGRWSKDEEIKELIRRLIDKLEIIE